MIWKKIKPIFLVDPESKMREKVDQKKKQGRERFFFEYLGEEGSKKSDKETTICIEFKKRIPKESKKATKSEDGTKKSILEALGGEYDKRVAKDIFKQCKSGYKGTHCYLIDYIKSFSLAPEFSKIEKLFKNWKVELEEYKTNPDSSVDILDDQLKHVYNRFTRNFRHIVALFCGSVKEFSFSRLIKDSGKIKKAGLKIVWDDGKILKYGDEYHSTITKILAFYDKMNPDLEALIQEESRLKVRIGSYNKKIQEKGNDKKVSFYRKEIDENKQKLRNVRQKIRDLMHASPHWASFVEEVGFAFTSFKHRLLLNKGKNDPFLTALEELRIRLIKYIRRRREIVEKNMASCLYSRDSKFASELCKRLQPLKDALSYDDKFDIEYKDSRADRS